MPFLFKIFLLFCSRDFRDFYAENQRRGLIDPEVRRRVAFLFLFWLLVVLLPLSILSSAVWNDPLPLAETIRSMETGNILLGVLVIGGLVFYCTGKIREIGRKAFAYSAGQLVEARLMSISSNNLGQRRSYTHHYRYKIKGFEYRKSFPYKEDTVPAHKNPGDSEWLIYTPAAPEEACVYEVKDLADFCLIRDREMPGKPARWQLDERAKELDKPKKPFLYQK
ncbi:DUF3592 domain-containing protein [Kiloniella laminariae]|uniref:DUF3592 domain-containing protein n=1 Tax=Kiloniella laminariae TaxID=454162 RepID=UPI00036F2328|nr:DUF3592 domain-containing protein [Kiloniella laminariae]